MKIIDSIEFGLYSPEQIRKLSTIKITVPDTYDEDGYPIPSGLMDQHLGVIDPGLKCKTDGNTMKNCTGFFGHIELVRPVIHVGFGRHAYQLLKATCRKCSRLLVDDSTIDHPKQSSECPHCGEKQAKIKFIKPTTFYEDERRLLPNEIRERLERISDESLAQLKVKVRPEWMVLTVLLVPPVNVRPSITLETGERSEDDLTHKLVDIIRINQRLGENIDAGAPQLIIEDLWELLQYHVTTFFDNETAGIPPARHRNGRQLKTLFQRLKGKEGRFRYNLSGKRVNFSARTVVSPDPTLGINDIGVPAAIAKELTVPVSVTPWNIENIKQMLSDKMDKINYLIRPDGKRKRLVETNLEEVLAELAAGYVVERQLMDGDVVVFNRQPSLHKVSMMAHRVRVLDGKTFRFNVADCAPYNADFDGDEMNIHVPQTEEAQAEAEILMKVGENILSPRHGHPLVSPELDQISGLYLLTQKEVSFPKQYAGNLLAAGGITRAEFKGSKVTGRELFSAILPPKMNFECKTRRFKKGDEEDAMLVVKNGKMTSGVIDARSSDAVLKHIFEAYGSQAASDYLDAATRISVLVATDFGLSLSLNDYKLTEKATEELVGAYKQARRDVHKLVVKYKEGKLQRQPGKTQRETLEEQVMDVVEAVRNDAWDCVKKHIHKSNVQYGDAEIEFNPAIMMSEAGARGKPINVIQMTGLVGQQAVRGKRMRSGYKNRILPHYGKGDLGDSARGFVKSSYTHGLTPMEYFFHAAGGRDSVVDKGVNPAKTGYMQRRLINALQDLIVQPNAAVHDAEGSIIQFKYGDDGKSTNSEHVPYGEPVGVIAAQSIGEPGTQMTLRTFHYAGVASLAQFGFTRLVEIIDATRTPKSPVMEVYLKKEHAKDYNRAKKVAAEIEQLTLGQIAVVKENFDRKSIRIELDEKAMRERGIKEAEITEKIKDIAPFVKTQTGFTVKPKTDSIRNVRKVTTKLYETTIRGVTNISRAIILEKEGGEYVLATEGSNIAEIMKVPEVDPARTTTNDIHEVELTLGIEAARNSIINEMLKVLDAQGLRVDVRHIMLIADAMTAKGSVKSSGRHGMAGEKASVLARAAFEETAKHLLNAAVKGETDTLQGITENIIIGQTIPCGTGKVKLEMDA